MAEDQQQQGQAKDLGAGGGPTKRAKQENVGRSVRRKLFESEAPGADGGTGTRSGDSEGESEPDLHCYETLEFEDSKDSGAGRDGTGWGSDESETDQLMGSIELSSVPASKVARSLHTSRSGDNCDDGATEQGAVAGRGERIRDTDGEQEVDTIGSGNNKFWTVPIWGYKPSDRGGYRKPEFIWVDHGDHGHALWYGSLGNRRRAIKRILDYMLVPESEQWQIIANMQWVKQVYQFLYYLVRRVGFTSQLFGSAVNELMSIYRTMNRIDRDDERLRECTKALDDKRTQRSTNSKVEIGKNLDYKESMWGMLEEDCKKHQAWSIGALQAKVGQAKLLEYYKNMGTGWKSTAQLVIDSLRIERTAYENSHGFLEVAKQMREQNCKHTDEEMEIGVKWLDDYFKVQKIDKELMLSNVCKIMEKRVNKINTLVFIGPTNTGKSLLANLIGKPYLKGYVQRSAEGNSFHFEGLLNKSVAMLEEPRITALTMNDYKVLLGGEDFEVNKKHQAPEILKRIPVLITTNAPIGSYLQPVDAKALDNRAITIHIDEQLNVGREFTSPKITLCTCHLIESLQKIW